MLVHLFLCLIIVFFFFLQLAMAEATQRQILDSFASSQENIPHACKMIKSVHQLVENTIGDPGVTLASTYVTDIVKYAMAFRTHISQPTNPLPRITLVEAAGKYSQSQAGTSSAPPSAGPSYHNLQPRVRGHGPMTPRGWSGGRTPHRPQGESDISPSTLFPTLQTLDWVTYGEIPQHAFQQ